MDLIKWLEEETTSRSNGLIELDFEEGDHLEVQGTPKSFFLFLFVFC